MKATYLAMRLRPLDMLFFRDGRPFGAASQVESGQPQPQTVAGALRTALLQAYGADFVCLGKCIEKGVCFAEAVQEAGAASWIGTMQVAGPWFRKETDAGEKVLFPTPAILHRDKDQFFRLAPLPDGELPGWRPPVKGLRPLWPMRKDVMDLTIRDNESKKPAGGYLTREGMLEFLKGGLPKCEQWRGTDGLFALDRRTGIVIDGASNTAKEGMIYAAAFLALAKGVSLHVELKLPDEDAKRAAEDVLRSIAPLPLGGEGRRVAVKLELLDSVLPLRVEVQGQGRELLALGSPGVFRQGWLPSDIQDDLVAACIAGQGAVSGWDYALGGPKKTRFTVAAGSVYFRKASQPFDKSALTDEPEDAALGFGHIFKGVWNDA